MGTCPNCGAPAEADDRFCTECGTSLEAAPEAESPWSEDDTPVAVACPECGTEAAPGQQFCMSCGHPLDRSAGDTAVAPPGPTARAAPAAQPARPSAPTPTLVVRVPDWLGHDWGRAALVAVLALVIGVAFQVVVAGVLLLFRQLLLDDPVAWGDLLRAPAEVFVAFHGPIERLGLWATGVLWVAISFRLAIVFVDVGDLSRGTMAQRLAFVGKAAVLYVIPVTVAAAVLDPEPLFLAIPDTFAGGFNPALFITAEWNVALTFFLGLIAATVACVWALGRRGGGGVWATITGARFETPRFLSGAWAGATRTVRVALPWMLALLLVGTLLEALNTDDPFRLWFVILIGLLVAGVMWAGVDVAAVFLIASLRLFAGEGAGVDAGVPGWMWVGPVILAAGLMLGGYRAAGKARARTAAESVGAGLLVGPLVGVIMFVLTWFVIGVGEDLTAPALGLPIVWSIVSGIGGLIYANRSGMISGVAIEVRSGSSDGS